MISGDNGEEVVIPLPLLLAVATKLAFANGGVGNLNNLLLQDIVRAIELELEQREARLH